MREDEIEMKRGSSKQVFAPRLTEYKTSKGAIQPPNNKELSLALIAEIARWSWEMNRK